jgi:uncharacterized 2Fe-2S/4Fe-4S cluster protein (DUF4445 family)
VEVSEGENLLRAALLADIVVHASCGGDGTCGKCLMIVESGDVAASPSARLTAEQAAAGYVVGCKTTVLGDVTVRIPDASRPGAIPSGNATRRAVNPILSRQQRIARLPRHTSPPPVAKRLVRMTPPDTTDSTNDARLVKLGLRRAHGIRDATISLAALRELPRIAREGGWVVTAIAAEPCDTLPGVSGFQAGDTTDCQYAVAVDIGTTTVEVAVIDLNTGAEIAREADYNGQTRLGDDVISRIIASTKPGGLEELGRLVTETIVKLVETALSTCGASEEDIVCYYVAGNTVMTHLLLGITPEHIRTAPYTPVTSSFPWLRAQEFGLPSASTTRLYAMPCPASWLGGDIVAGVVAAGMPWTEKLTLFIDIGTNGEIVLGNSEWLVSTSCSAGPAFEGRGIRHGMRAAEGAIEQVRIDSETLEPSYLTIGAAKPAGICGSGLIDCVSELFLCGALERTGSFVAELDNPHVREGDSGREYVLVDASSSATGCDIVLTESDIDNLMRAKAAIFAGITVLAESLDVDLNEIEEVVVAGGFGRYLDLERVVALGMVPELPRDRFVFLGNGSLLGAALAATSREVLRTARKTGEMMTYLELSVNAGFMDSYMSALFLPHTDLGQFPQTEKLRAERSRIGAVS